MVGSDAGGLPEVVRARARAASSCRWATSRAWPRATIEILKDDERRREMGEAARHRVESLFGADRVVSQYEAVYERVLGS